MKNMTLKEKIIFISLQVITLGLIWFYWKKKAKKYNQQNSLSQEVKIGVNVIKLITLLGGPNNIKNISNTHTKVKIEYYIRERVEVENIKKMRGVSGLFINDSSITIIVGNSANSLRETIQRNISSTSE